MQRCARDSWNSAPIPGSRRIPACRGDELTTTRARLGLEAGRTVPRLRFDLTECFSSSPCVFGGHRRQQVSQLAPFSEMGPMLLWRV